MEQAMASARAKNAAGDTGWASNLVEAAVRAKDAMNALRSDEGPKAVMKPAPTCPPKEPPGPFFSSPHRSDDEPPEHWMVMSPKTPQHSDGNGTSEHWAAAKQAAEVIAKAEENVFPSQPRAKPAPKGFEYVNTTGKASSSCPVLKAILDRNGDEPLPPPPEIKPPPLRFTSAERNAMEAAKERQQQRDRMMTGTSPSTDVILKNAQQALEQAKARQKQQPPVKGSTEHKKSLLKTKPPTKPAPGFPPGTAIPRGFDVVDSGRLLYQPALLSDHMLLAQSEAAKLAMVSIPREATAKQMIAPNGQVMIALVNPHEMAPPLDPRWNAPSAVISRCRCAFCGEEDQ
eukprot:6462122-Amphidinium_carterae.1